MRKNVLSSALIFLLCTGSLLPLLAQADGEDRRECLEITGIATDQRGIAVPGAEVTLYCQNEALEWTEVPSVSYHEHSFRFMLKENEYYTIKISRPGFVTRSIGISTVIPPTISLDPIFQYEFEVQLFPEKEIADDYYLDFPVAIIRYDPKTGLFNYSNTYTKNIKQKIRNTYGPVQGITLRGK